MRPILLAAALLLATPATARGVAPYVYAGIYCQARDNGTPMKRAVELALSVSMSEHRPSRLVMVDGQQRREDHLASVYLVNRLCPQWLDR